MKSKAVLKRFVDKDSEFTSYRNLLVTDPDSQALFTDGKIMVWDKGFNFDGTFTVEWVNEKYVPKDMKPENVYLPNYRRVVMEPGNVVFELDKVVRKPIKKLYKKKSETPLIHFHAEGITCSLEADRTCNEKGQFTGYTPGDGGCLMNVEGSYNTDTFYNARYFAEFDIVSGHIDEKGFLRFETATGEEGILAAFIVERAKK